MSEREKNARILFVVDDPLLLRVGARLLGDAGYEVIEAATGQDGLRLAQERKPDLALLDVMLPDLNGFEVCRRIKADPQLANTHVVMLSATRAESDSQTEALEGGAMATLPGRFPTGSYWRAWRPCCASSVRNRRRRSWPTTWASGSRSWIACMASPS